MESDHTSVKAGILSSALCQYQMPNESAWEQDK